MDDRYQISQLLEELAFGNIYEAEDTLIQRKVQIFRYFVHTSGNEAEWKEAFNAASAKLATASHPGLPIIYTHGIDDEGPYTIRQLIESTVLNTRLAESGPLSEYEAWELAHQMLEIHDTAKPSGNFHGALDANHIGLITRPSGKKFYSITDYGLAEVSRRMLDSTDYAGAPYLISPEQAKGEPASELSQIYAIGQLVFHALAGGHPWIQTSLEEIIELQKNQPLGLVTDYNTGVPDAMAQWISKLIALDPNERFQSYQEATASLPEPIQSAPVPIQSKSAIYAASHTTANQTVAADGTGPVSAADAFAAQQAATEADKKAAYAEKAKILKNPLVLGGIGTVLLIIICTIIFTGEDDDGDDSNYVSTKAAEKVEIAKLPRDGMVAYIDFNDAQITAVNNTRIRLEPLKDKAIFTRNGRSGKGLILDENHYFRLPLSGTPMENSPQGFTISFWVKPRHSADQDLIAVSQKPWKKGQNEAFKGDSATHVWKPEQAVIVGSTWNMITMVCARSAETITIYIDGKKIDSSPNGEVNNINNDPFIYLGCDSSENFYHASPVTIDNVAIWERELSDVEINDLFGH